MPVKVKATMTKDGVTVTLSLAQIHEWLITAGAIGACDGEMTTPDKVNLVEDSKNLKTPMTEEERIAWESYIEDLFDRINDLNCKFHDAFGCQ